MRGSAARRVCLGVGLLRGRWSVREGALVGEGADEFGVFACLERVKGGEGGVG